MHLLLATGLALALLAPSAHAQTPTCAKLTGSQKALAAELLASQHPYYCCGETIAKCLEKKHICALAFRLAENICRRVAYEQSKDRIVAALWERSRSMLGGGKGSSIDLTGLAPAGDANAPIALVEYACPRCPYCAMITPEIYDAVVQGRLKGKAKLYFKTYPILAHRHAKETGLAFLAAQKQGHFWEFVLHFYRRFDRLLVLSQLTEWAKAVGMNREVFQHAMADPATSESLAEIRKEGIVNDVNATPTFFINGRKYHGELTRDELIDVLEEEFDRIKGIQYRE